MSSRFVDKLSSFSEENLSVSKFAFEVAVVGGEFRPSIPVGLRLDSLELASKEAGCPGRSGS